MIADRMRALAAAKSLQGKLTECLSNVSGRYATELTPGGRFGDRWPGKEIQTVSVGLTHCDPINWSDRQTPARMPELTDAPTPPDIAILTSRSRFSLLPDRTEFTRSGVQPLQRVMVGTSGTCPRRRRLSGTQRRINGESARQAKSARMRTIAVCSSPPVTWTCPSESTKTSTSLRTPNSDW